ncbi:hypothetical protein EZS27_030045 [termite gut metagenome]|uniref:DUF2961 domain-containing protein n=1 Tax=termite gut metagenome TaxID=433724 RepID=A0A5J4QH37_9ZZZZ
MGWGVYSPLVSLPVYVNPGSAFNCYWTMPFRKNCKITMENINDQDAMTLYYQIDYTLTEVPGDAAYFHAKWRRSNPTKTSDYSIVDNIKGIGHFVGVYMAWGVNNNGWWGEGEIKFFMDGDSKFPTICGTDTEDYFCGSSNFDRDGQYKEFCTPYSGLPQVIHPDGTYHNGSGFIVGISMIRFVLKKTYVLLFKIWVGIKAVAICLNNRIYPLLHFGIRPNRIISFPNSWLGKN